MKLERIIKCILVMCCMYVTPSYGQWHDWTAASIDNIEVMNCNWSFSTDAYYQNPKSIRIDYETNATITFPYNYPMQSLNGNVYFLLAVYNPAESHADDEMTVEFLVNGTVRASWSMTNRRSGWNVYKVYQTSSYKKPYYYDFKLPLTGNIPSNTTHMRIHMPNHSGSLYIGKLLLCTEATYTSLGMLRTDQFHPMIADAVVPPAPSLVTQEQRNQIAAICTRLDEAYDVLTESQMGSLNATVKSDLYNRYSTHNITRNGNIVNGSNIMLKEAETDYYNYRTQYGSLAFEIAQAYRNVQNVSDKNLLKSWYLDMYDYAIFLGGLFDSWEGGRMFVPSMFLMREELIATGRITPEVLQDLRQTIGFEKVYLDYSFFIKEYMLYRGYYTKTPRPYEVGELGEDIDYLRLCSIRLLMAALFNQDEKEQVRDLKAVSHYFSDIAFQYSPGIHDGFKEDGTLNHHWGWLDNYGVSCLNMMPRIVYALSNTEFKISPEAHKLIYNQLVSLDMRGLQGIIPSTTTGKGGEIYAYGGNSVVESGPYAYMAFSGGRYGESSDLDVPMASLFLRAINNQAKSTAMVATGFEKKARKQLIAAGLTAAAEPSGHVTYSQGLAMIHRRDNWLATIKGASRYAYVRESSDPFITYMGYGMIEINNATFDRYGLQKLVSDFGVAGYDWRKIPGTTTVDFANFSSMVNKEYKRYWPNSTFAGGVNQGGNGIFSMKVVGSVLNNLGTYVANKSYFCFDNYIVCVGSGITNNNSDPTITTLFQDAVKNTESTYVGSTTGITTIPYAYNQTLLSSNWLLNSHKIGYWIPAGEQLTLNRSSQTCPNWKNNGNATGTFATAYLSHGAKPNNAQYWYINAIDCTAQQMASFNEQMNSTEPPFSLLENNERVHAVESRNNKSYGISVINASHPIAIKDVMSVSRPTILLVNAPDEESRILSIADPDVDYKNNLSYTDNEYWGYSNMHEVVVKLNGQWLLAQSVPNVTIVRNDDGTTTLTFAVRNGLTTTVMLKKDEPTGLLENEDMSALYYDGKSIVVNYTDRMLSTPVLGAIYSVTGLKIKNMLVNINETTHIDVTDLSSGAYIFTLETTQDKKVLRFNK